jgi:hypothetical protein
MSKNVSDGHLWFSIFLRPPSNKFSRVQRCTCCFVLLFITMLFNILYYQQIDQSKTEEKGFTLGPFYITIKQIYMGIIIEFFSSIPSLLVVQFFRSIRQKNRNEKQGWTVPWWWIYFAYSFSFIIVGISTFFIVVQSIELGDLEVQKWLTSIIAGLCSSIFLTQPIQVINTNIFIF